MPRNYVIIGPPGTGKTTAGVDLARDWLKEKVGPAGVAYLAFTKAAATEAASRILDKELREAYGDKLPYFRTIHSLAYRGLKKEKDDIRVITQKDMKDFARWSGLDGRYTVTDWEDLSEVYQKLVGGGRTVWDHCMNAYTISRISAQTPGELELAKTRMSRTSLRMTRGLIEEDTYRAFVNKYEAYKLANSMVDFTDMLAYALTEMPPLDEVRYVIVDEAQDCARILHSVVDRLFQNAEEKWWIGDVNQCQPAGTVVTLANGTKKGIETLAVGDRVLSFDRRGSAFTGRRKGHGIGGSSVVRTATRLYTGPLFEMDAAGMKTKFTQEHKFIVKGLGEATLMEAKACKLLPGLMTVPIDTGQRDPSWVPFTLTTSDVKDLPVYSLELDRYHTYVADGIGTHNCIFNFAAADARLFLQRIHEADHRIALRQTHRFGQAIVDFSAKIIRRARDRFLVDIIGVPDRKHEIKVTGSFSPVVEPMFILHRHVMGCQAAAEAYIQEGKPFRNERGRDPLGSEKRVLAFKALHALADGKDVSAGAVGRLVDDFMPSLLQPQIATQGKTVRLVVHGAKKKLQEGIIKGMLDLKSLVTAKLLTQEGADVVRQRAYRVFRHPEDLEYYHRVVQNGHSLDGTEIPVITTIHGSKGRQAPRVVVFDEMNGKCWDDPDAEHRLAYVAATRTRGDVEICAEKNVGWAHDRYDYPVDEEGDGKGNGATEVGDVF